MARQDGIDANTAGKVIFGAVYVVMILWIGWPWPETNLVLKDGGYGGWLGATASFFTGIVALWIASRGDRRLQRESDTRAILVGARIQPLIHDTIVQVEVLCRQIMMDRLKNQYEPIPYSRSLDAICGAFDQIRPVDLEALIPIADSAAHRVSHAIGVAKALQRELQSAAVTPNHEYPQGEDRDELTEHWEVQLKITSDHLGHASRAMAQANEAAIPSSKDY